MNTIQSIPSGGVVLSLAGKTALVTGGSRGIGFGIGKRFVEAGANVILVARRPDVLAAAKAELEILGPGRVSAYTSDVGDRTQLSSLCEELQREHQAIDILVNNAGASNQRAFEQTSDEIWQSDLDSKLFSAIRLTRFVIPDMKARRWGRILNVVSINGKTPPAGGTPSCVSRAAGIALSKALAGELAPHNILVNALCLGNIMSDQIHRRHQVANSGLPFEAHVQHEARSIPLGRLGTADECANVALFLASEAGSYLTGTAINIDGGLCRSV